MKLVAITPSPGSTPGAGGLPFWLPAFYHIFLLTKADVDIKTPVPVDSDITKKELRRNWARLIQKVYYTVPLLYGYYSTAFCNNIWLFP
ncbi:hypothetical protein [Syntrophomonas wolfei]|uniref:Uncharacterized protein n=1 Tax=Syntrophomonas wolfei subsp. wolfei (strain DSM 2245B / Goettingen) TaxID=335541 RepID=Q0AYA3_SYNWW|nr:hypothetical protein [Syntrophomonas wolfei]ABI68301.1 hypothetical protein Swol_0987 [Syntrophomonas wolfei subsp. wolfei str. Goettingen G311]